LELHHAVGLRATAAAKDYAVGTNLTSIALTIVDLGVKPLELGPISARHRLSRARAGAGL